jgi:integrase
MRRYGLVMGSRGSCPMLSNKGAMEGQMRTLRDSKLDTAAARLRLPVSGKPHWRLLDPGLHLGYRRLKGRSGTWVRRRYLGGEKYDTESIGTADDYGHADGQTILDFKQAQDKCRGRPTAKAGPYTIGDAVEDYLVWLEAERKSGLDARKRAEALILQALGDRKCDALTTDDINAWRNNLAKQPPRARTGKNAKQRYRKFDDNDPEAVRRRRATVNRLWTILRGALNKAFRDGKIASDTAWKRVKPFQSADAARVHYLEIADATRLINGCDPDFRLLVQAALETGCRFGELARLETRDFNRDAGTIHIRQSKSGKARHTVLANDGIRLFERLVTGRSGGDLIFQNNGQPWKTTQRPMAEACKRARINPAISFHVLRHTWASHAVMNGVPLMVVAKNLGHSDTRMVEKHYGHLAPSYIVDAIRNGAPRFNVESDNVTAIR